MVFLIWHNWALRPVKPVASNALHGAFVAAIFMIFSIFSGAFLVGQSRDKCFRWLRPVGAWMILSFVVAALSTLSILMFRFGYGSLDYYTSRVILVVYLLLGLEQVMNFVTEFYRPRTIEEPRPVFESRLLSLFTEPGGVVRNIADTLDYQFGFKVSKTWIYGFMEKSLFPLLIVWFVVLWMFTCITEVGPSQVGVKERFGKVCSETLLEPGVYFTLPYPFGKVARFSCTEIHQVLVGPKMEDSAGKKSSPEVVTWTEEHYAAETYYLVASEKVDNSKTPATAVSFLGISVPVQYHISREGLFDYAYRNKDAPKMLQSIGEMVAAKYFASVSMLEIMSDGRHTAAEDLKRLMQEAVNKQQLGIEIICVNLHDVHPPTKEVAPAFQDVIGSMEERESEILKAKVFREKVIPEADVEVARLKQNAIGYREQITMVAKAEGERFNKQLQAYQIMPSLYRLRTYLDMLEKDCKDARKYIVSSSINNEVYELNFEKKATMDLIDADLGAINPNSPKNK
jgi:regulator of protease activity HflC (stomatin/prohibitin superfamily)